MANNVSRPTNPQPINIGMIFLERPTEVSYKPNDYLISIMALSSFSEMPAFVDNTSNNKTIETISNHIDDSMSRIKLIVNQSLNRPHDSVKFSDSVMEVNVKKKKVQVEMI